MSKYVKTKRKSDIGNLGILQPDKHPVVSLILIFVISAIFRYAISLKTENMPTVYIDEGLYINIARSLFCEGKVLYRAQPITYVYLGYPIFLLPLFLLPASVSLFRAVQLYNAILMSSAVFPAFILGRKMDLTEKDSLLLSLLTALIPELALSSFLTAESLYYPMMIWMFVLGTSICMEQSPKKRTILYVILGCITGFLYFVKPICVIFGVCFCIVDAVMAYQRREKGNMLTAILCIVFISVFIAAGYMLYHTMFGEATVLNLYEKQIEDTTVNSIPIMLQSVLYHAVGIVFACGGVYVLLPWFNRKNYTENQQQMMVSTMVGLTASILGVAVMVVPYNYTGSGFTSPIHLRYLMYFFPLLFVFSLCDESSGKILKSKGLFACIGIVSLMTIFPSAYRFFNYQAGAFDAPALNAFCERTSSRIGVVLILLSLLGNLFILYHVFKSSSVKMVQKCGSIVLVIFFIVNNICTYSARRTTEKSFEENATELAELIMNEENLLVVTNNAYDDFRGYQLDSHVRKPVQMVVMNDVLQNAVFNDGCYQSWTPYVQAPNTSNNQTVDADTLVFDITTSDYVEFADNVRIEKIGDYTIARINKDQPFLKTAIASMDGYFLRKEGVGSLLVYDKSALAKGRISLDIVMKSSGMNPCDVTFSSEGQTETVTVQPDWKEFEVTLPVSGNGFFKYTITAPEDILIGNYHTDAGL